MQQAPMYSGLAAELFKLCQIGLLSLGVLVLVMVNAVVFRVLVYLVGVCLEDMGVLKYNYADPDEKAPYDDDALE